MRTPKLNSRANKAWQGPSRGFTLIEVLIALALFAIIGITFAGGLSTASRTVITADVRTNAESLARTQMEYIKNQPYSPAPTGGVGNYTKIAGIPAGYTICSFNRTGPAVDCGALDRIIAIPWDSETDEPASEDNGLQRIKLVVKHDDIEVITLEDYKVDR